MVGGIPVYCFVITLVMLVIVLRVIWTSKLPPE